MPNKAVVVRNNNAPRVSSWPGLENRVEPMLDSELFRVVGTKSNPLKSLVSPPNSARTLCRLAFFSKLLKLGSFSANIIKSLMLVSKQAILCKARIFQTQKLTTNEKYDSKICFFG